MAFDREQELIQKWLNKLGQLNFAPLSSAEQIDYVLLRNDLETSLILLGDRRDDAQELTPWLPFQSIINGLTEQRVHGDPLDAQAAASTLAPLAKRVSDLQAKLKATKDKKPDAKQEAQKPDSQKSEPEKSLARSTDTSPGSAHR